MSCMSRRRPWRHLLWLLAALAALAAFPGGGALAAPATTVAEPAPPQRIVLIGNDYAVGKGPTAPSIFTTTQPWHVVQIATYHWNDAKGTARTGTIRLKGLAGAKSYGPFRTKGSPGQGGVPNAYWTANVSFDLPPGRYQFIDSDPATWAQNTESGGQGMAWIMATPAETGPPKVTAFVPSRVYNAGATASLAYSVTEASGKAEVHIALYDGGALDTSDAIAGVKADGSRQTWTVELGQDVKGPMYFCVWAENAAGDKSANAPRSACKFISVLVPIERVSNGCGGEGWPSVVAAENYFGNTSTYTQPGGQSYTVSFVAACNLHDAGYGGQTVRDAINGGVLDMHAWSRRKVDDKFQSDMWTLCRRAIPEAAAEARRSCIRDGRRYLIVRTLGMNFFDYDVMKAGTQGEGARQ